MEKKFFIRSQVYSISCKKLEENFFSLKKGTALMTMIVGYDSHLPGGGKTETLFISEKAETAFCDPMDRLAIQVAVNFLNSADLDAYAREQEAPL